MYYNFYQIFSRKKQDELWKIFEEVSSEESDPDLVSFKTYEKFKELNPHRMEYYEFWGFIGEEAHDPTECPACKDIQVKALYAGLPLKLCVNEDCHTVTGLGSWLVEIWYNGVFFPYFGSYWKTLYHWLTVSEKDIEYK